MNNSKRYESLPTIFSQDKEEKLHYFLFKTKQNKNSYSRLLNQIEHDRKKHVYNQEKINMF